MANNDSLKLKRYENVISDLNNQVLNIRSQLAQRDANDLFEMDNLMEKISSMENEKSEQDKKIKLLSEQVSNYSSDIRKSVSANEKLKIDVERYKGVITSLKEEKESFVKLIDNLKKENEELRNYQIKNNNFKKQSIDNNTEEEQLEHIKKNLTEKEDENKNKNGK